MSLISKPSITSRIQLLEELENSLRSQNNAQIAANFDRLTSEDQNLLRAHAPSSQPLYNQQFRTRFRYQAEMRAVKEALALLRSQNLEAQASTPLVASATAPDRRCLSPSFGSPKRHKHDSVNTSTALTTTPISIHPHPVKIEIPHIFFQNAFFFLHPRDLRAFSCTAKNMSLGLRTFKQRQPLIFQMKHAIGIDDIDTLQRLVLGVPTPNRLTTINTLDAADNVILISACIREGSIKCLDFLVKEGADLTRISSSGTNVFHLAVLNIQPTCIRYLLDKISLQNPEAIDRLLNGRNTHGNTPLLCSARVGSFACMQLLLQAGANILDVNNTRDSLVHIGVRFNHFAFVTEVLASLEKSISFKLVNIVDKEGDNPLVYVVHAKVADSKKQEMLDTLFFYGINRLHINHNGQNFAHFAASERHPSLLDSYLKKLTPQVRTAIVKAKDFDGNIPLMHAVYNNTIPCAQLLIDAGSDLITSNYQDETPLWYCQKPSRSPMRRLLLAREPRLEGFHALNLFMHVFGVEKNFKLGGIAGTKLKFYGSHDAIMHEEFVKLMQLPSVREKMITSCTKPIYEQILYAFETSLLNDTDFNQAAVEKIRRGELVMITSGWEEHAVCLVWYKGYYVVCNRGAGSIDRNNRSRTFFARKVDLTLFNLDTLLQICKNNDATEEQGVTFLYTTLPNTLSGVEDSLCRDMIRIAPKASKAGVCTYASRKAALRASLALVTQKMALARTTAKSVATLHREEAFRYLKHTPSPFSKGVSQKLMTLGKKSLQSREK